MWDFDSQRQGRISEHKFGKEGVGYMYIEEKIVTPIKDKSGVVLSCQAIM